MPDKLAILGAGKVARFYAECAREMGVETHCFAWDRGAVAKDAVDYFHPISIFEEDEIAAICADLGIGGIVSTSELTIAPVARLAERLGLVGNPVEAAQEITDKYLNRMKTQDVQGLKHPRFAIVENVQDIADLNMEYPMVVKPASEGGKRGVTVVACREDLSAAMDYADAESKEGARIVAEGFIPAGMECSVESLSCGGKHYFIQVTEKVSSGPPHCVELGHLQPAAISQSMRTKIAEVLSDALTRIGVVNGPCHTEIKIVGEDVYLIEFNARPGGDLISHPLVLLSTGYSYLSGSIEIALGKFKGVDESQLLKRHAGVLFVTDETPELKPLFDKCESFDWLYEKHEVEGGSALFAHNNSEAANYFIFLSETERPDFAECEGLVLSKD